MKQFGLKHVPLGMACRGCHQIQLYTNYLRVGYYKLRNLKLVTVWEEILFEFPKTNVGLCPLLL